MFRIQAWLQVRRGFSKWFRTPHGNYLYSIWRSGCGTTTCCYFSQKHGTEIRVRMNSILSIEFCNEVRRLVIDVQQLLSGMGQLVVKQKIF